MSKDKKKKHKKDDVSEDILDVAALSIKKFRKVTNELSKLSTGQKLLGGIALVAAGLTYLATQETAEAGNHASAGSDQPEPLRRLAASFSEDSEDAPAPHRKPRKSAKPKPAPSSES